MNDLDAQSRALNDLPLHNDVANRTHSTTEIRTTPADTTRKHRNAIGTAVRP
jgi:hypothetical protein